jgi:hypothetical protein
VVDADCRVIQLVPAELGRSLAAQAEVVLRRVVVQWYPMEVAGPLPEATLEQAVLRRRPGIGIAK